MRNEEKLYLAISEVDDALIAEASAPYKKNTVTPMKILAVAACAVIITVGAIGALTLDLGSKGMAGDSAPESDMPNMYGTINPDYNAPGKDDEENAPGDDGCENVGSIIVGEAGSLTMIHGDGVSFSFKLRITKPQHNQLNVYLYSIDKSIVYSTAYVDEASCVYRPTILVDGKPADNLPTDVGEYYVTISFDGKNEINTVWENCFSIEGIGIVYTD